MAISALPPSYQNVPLFCPMEAILGHRPGRSFMAAEIPVSVRAYPFSREAPDFAERNKEGFPTDNVFHKAFQDRIPKGGRRPRGAAAQARGQHLNSCSTHHRKVLPKRWLIAVVGSAHDLRSFPAGWP